MKYFTISELSKSSIAKAFGIDNTPNPEAVDNMELLIDNLLDPIREAWGKPIYVNSGYRCEELNNIVKGAKKSQHKSGQAADITTNSIDGNRQLFDLIKTGGFVFDQLIDEANYAWVHISYNHRKNRRQILHLN